MYFQWFMKGLLTMHYLPTEIRIHQSSSHFIEKNYIFNHVFLYLREDWKQNLYDAYLVGAVLIYIAKVFHCIRHEFFIERYTPTIFIKMI